MGLWRELLYLPLRMNIFWFIASHKRLKRRERWALQPFGEGVRGIVAIGSLVMQDTVAGTLPSCSGTASDMHGWPIRSSYSVTSCLSSGSSDSSRPSLERMGSDQVAGAVCFQLEPNQAALDAGAARQGFPQHTGSLQPLLRLITGFRLLVPQHRPQRLSWLR